MTVAARRSQKKHRVASLRSLMTIQIYLASPSPGALRFLGCAVGPEFLFCFVQCAIHLCQRLLNDRAVSRGEEFGGEAAQMEGTSIGEFRVPCSHSRNRKEGVDEGGGGDSTLGLVCVSAHEGTVADIEEGDVSGS